MSEVITMNRDMLTEVMTQAMIRANQQRFGLPSRAAGEQSNIANRTEFYGLPLPTGNEIVAYQDFINDANNIIDAALHSIQNTLDTVSTTATNAADAVAAADTKIQGLVQDNINNESSTLPQFKKDTEARLDSLENDVMGLAGWSMFLTNSSGNITEGILKSSIGIWVQAHETNANSWDDLTETVRTYTKKDVTNAFSKKSLGGAIAGNILNLPKINDIYCFIQYSFESTGIVHTSGFGVKWTGVQTEFYDLESAAPQHSYYPSAIYPMTPMTN